MGQIFEYVKIAYKSIVSNKGRTFLTMLGIIIGIASVIMISGLGSGVKNAITGALGDMFKGQTYIYAYNDVYISQEDLNYVKENVPELIICSPETTFYGYETYSVKGNYTADLTMVNETYEFNETYGKGMLYGRYFTEDEVDNGELVCVMREDEAISFFGSADVVGQEIIVVIDDTEVTFKVVGVRNASESQTLSLLGMVSTESRNITLEVPYTFYEEISGYDWYSTDFYSILVSLDSTVDATEVVKRVVDILEARNNCRGEEQFTIDSFDSEMETVNKVIGYVTVFIAFVSAISLVVGGVGVMNIMLVSVTERTQEIGIRKALGARTGSIMIQFLSEAGMITFVGGLIGVIVGYAGAEALCLIAGAIVKMSINIDVSIPIVIASCLFSTAIGVGFGIFPAKKAAKLSPIEALRQE